MATILVVDDRAVNRQFLVTLLRYRGHRLLEAADGAEALAVARGERPDLVITDILMPTMNGFELVERLRGEAATAEIPIIFYTATYRVREARRLAEACGASSILAKPSSPQAILAAVAAALGGEAAAPPGPFALPVSTQERERWRLVTDQLGRHLSDLEDLNAKMGEVATRGDEVVAQGRTLGELSERLADSTLKLQEIGVRLAGVLELSLDLATLRDPERLLEIFCAAAQDLLGAGYAGLLMLDDDGRTVRHVVARGVDAALLGEVGTVASREGVFGQLLALQRSVRRSGLEGDPSAAGLPPGHPPVRSFLAVPLSSSQGLYGWFYIADKKDAPAFSEEDEQLAATLGAQVAVAYENARLYETIQAHAAQLQLEVAERKHAEAQLREREAEYRFLFESNPHPMWVFDKETHAFLAVNEAAVKQYGWSQEEFLGMTIRDIRPPEEIPPLLETLDARAPGGARPPGREVWTHHRKDGSLIRVKVTAGSILFRGRKARLVLATDLTEREQLEAQLRQAQKMEAVGRLAGGIAHDFNNLLTTILGYCDLVLAQLGEGAPLAEELTEIHRAGERAAVLTRQLLAFSRRQVLAPKVLDLNALVVDLERMLRRVIGEDVELVTALDSDLGRVEADAGQLEQVIMNLVVNARDAMPDGGRLTLRTANAERSPAEAGETRAGEGERYVLLAIADTGVGMSEEIRNRAFEPFFTTKEPGKGTGLGLATAYGIVTQSGGRIEIASEPGRGTTLEIYLPRVEAEPAAEAHVEPAPLRGGAETVLLLEDEPGVRSLISNLLQAHGYRVVEAAAGEQALVLAAAEPGPIHLVLTDVVMPGSSGPRVASGVRARHPEAKVLLMSGYTDDAILRSGGLDRDLAFLQKPFTPEALVRKVREVLDRPAVPE